MAAWIEDAQILTELRDLNSNLTKILQRTQDVSDFLSEDMSNSAALVAPKGFGKTFLLKLKRIVEQEAGYFCLPKSPIVDRPKDKPPILPNSIIDLMESSESWETLWSVAFSISILKNIKNDSLVDEYVENLVKISTHNTALINVLKNYHIETPFEVLHCCLSGSRSDLFDIVKSSSNFTSAFSRLHRQIALFVDNIDEYLESYINYEYLKNDSFHNKYLKIWHNGQIGAWRSIRRLNGINPHVRIFITLRKEAYHYAMDKEPIFANLRAFSHKLEYGRGDITKIIENNIKSEPKSKLVHAGRRDLLTNFAGDDAQIISNSGTGKQERLMEYWLRHCTYRPRDAVSIGGQISKIKAEIRSKETIRAAINKAAAERVQNLFREVIPFFDGFYPEIFPLVIKSNVLNVEELSQCSKNYKKLALERYQRPSVTLCHPFCALYAIGLIGVVQEDRDKLGSLVQKFASVGEVPFGSTHILPKAETYLIHPSLSDFIVGKDVSFLHKMNRHNVVGDGLEWRPQEERRFVLVGDMRGYREKIMESVGASQTFDDFWKKLFRRNTLDLDFSEVSGGDSCVLADRSPIRVLRACFKIMAQLSSSGYKLNLRVGGHVGHWQIRHDDDGVAHAEISDILGVAARIEPHARPGDILVTEEFVKVCIDVGFDLENLDERRVGNEYFKNRLVKKGGKVNIGKSGKEREDLHFLFRLDESCIKK